MKVRDVMHSGCTYCGSNDSVMAAAQLMAKEDLGFVPVAENDRLVGMLTDRDIVVRGLAQGHDLTSAKIADVMSDHVYYCYDDQDCEEIAQNMGEMQVRRMPVVDRQKQLIGVVSLADLAHKGIHQAAGATLDRVTLHT
jgi:CBS domain-containing protein